MLQFDIEDMGSQRLASGICATLRQIGSEVQKNVNLETRALWLEVSRRRVTQRGDAMIKTWEQVSAEFEHRLKLAAAGREEEGTPYVPTEPVHKWSIARFRGQLDYLLRQDRQADPDALVEAYKGAVRRERSHFSLPRLRADDEAAEQVRAQSRPLRMPVPQIRAAPNYRALRMLVERGWLAKTGERSRREYALTPTGLAERTQAPAPAPSPGRTRPVCRMCGRPGGHWSGCPLNARGRD